MADGYASRFNNVAYQADTERRLDAVGWVQSSTGLTRAGKRPGTGLEVTVLSGPERAQVAPGRALVEHSTLGAHRFWLNASVTKPLAARPSSGTSRIDLVTVQIFNSEDGITSLREPQIVVLTGTASSSAPVAPTVPDGSLVLKPLTVPSTGAIAVGPSVARTVTSGGIVPVIDQTDRDSIQPYNGLKVYRDDLGVFQSYRNGAWENDPTAADVAANTTASRIYATSATSLTAGLFSKVTLSAVSYGPANVNNSSYIVPRTGIVDFRARASAIAQGAGERFIICVYLNGAEVSRGTDGATPIGNVPVGGVVSDRISVVAGDVIDLRVYASVARNTESGSATSFLACRMV